MSLSSSSLLDRLQHAALQQGFACSGAVDIDLAENFSDHISVYDQWLSLGYSGEMHYLTRGRDRRANPREVFPKAKSVFCVLEKYTTSPRGALSSKEGPRYARYLQGEDYHLMMKEKLEKMMSSLKESEVDLSWKVCVDTSAVLERSWAAFCGLGWIGKNKMLIHPQLGSYTFIGVVFLDQEVGCAPRVLPNYCGNCTRCLEGCPTQAFRSSGFLDSNRCISYLTLEKRGELDIDEGLKEKWGSWVAGCDVCQEVCPFNRKATAREASQGIEEDRGAVSLKKWDELRDETEEEYRRRVKRSSLNRVKPAQFKRNLELAFQNSKCHQNELHKE